MEMLLFFRLLTIFPVVKGWMDELDFDSQCNFGHAAIGGTLA